MMRLVHKITLTFILPLVLTLGLWGWLSYRTMERKIHADTDMILKEYSDEIIMRILSGRELPERFNGAYNTYYIEDVTEEFASSNPAVEYGEAEVLLLSQEEFASSRIRRQIFEDQNGNYHRLTVSLPTFEQDVLVEHVLWWTVVLFVVLMITLILMGVMVINYTMRPFYSLLKWMDDYVPGAPSDPVPSDTDVIEFRRLASTVQKAVDRFERQYEDRKMFIGNVSHELQTPLAACINRIEMMLDYTSLPEGIAVELSKLHRSISSLVRLNKTLLMMSRIENGQFASSASVNVTDLMKEIVALNEEIYAGRNLCVRFSGGEDDIFFVMDEQMASMLVGNLVRNAFRYAPSGSEILIDFTDNGFSISNAGSSPLDEEKVFRKFYQPSGRKEGSTGLGLALVHTICVNNRLEVSYTFDKNCHIFRVNSVSFQNCV